MLTSVHCLLEVKRGLMVVPKPTMFSFVPAGRLFSATTMASWRKRKCGLKTRRQGMLKYSRLWICLFPPHSVFHLYALDLGATHATTAVHQEQQLSGGSVRFQRFTQQVGTEVEHQDGAAENVLVVPLPHKLHLQSPDNNRNTDAGKKTKKSKTGKVHESTHLSFWVWIFPCAADKISAGTNLLFILAEWEPPSLQYDQWTVRFCQRFDRENVIDVAGVMANIRSGSTSLTTQVQNNLNVSVVGMLLRQCDIGCRGTLGTGVSVGPQGVSGALQTCTVATFFCSHNLALEQCVF